MEKLSSILQEHVAQEKDTTNKLLGAAFVVVNAKDVLFSGSSGRIDFDPNSRPFNTDTFTWMASMTKIITITCFMQLIERGEIGLDEDVRPRVPELAKMQILCGFDDNDKPILEDNTKLITFRHLLTHTLGLGSDLADPDLTKWSKAVGRTDTILSWNREGINTPLKFAPGEGWYYGAATDWAGVILEDITGETLGTYTQKNILEPLGIKDTGFWPEKLPQTADRTAVCTYREGKTLKPGPLPPPKEHILESAGAGLYSTAQDYATFFQGLLQGKLVKEETLQEMFSPQLNETQAGILEMIAYNIGGQDAFSPEYPKGAKLNHGIGGVLNVEDVPGKRRKGSLMWSGMCNSRWWIDRATGIAAALIVNVQPHGDPVVKNLYNELELEVYRCLGIQ
ncbi:hypothetical protein CEP51_016299 [Fusarium floridanum]|uniref:Beta-lactamase-related domain-containing protein n=1 Tax=Fusarium floridanum TaxID=1325733 RepID=A0A428NT20_9HYPO|nr:hypothetical protein CEP51_016299 [Fusarium floridanum]